MRRMDVKHFARLTYILEKSSAALMDVKDTQTFMIRETKEWLKKNVSTGVKDIETLSPYTDNTHCLSCSVSLTQSNISEFNNDLSCELRHQKVKNTTPHSKKTDIKSLLNSAKNKTVDNKNKDSTFVENRKQQHDSKTVSSSSSGNMCYNTPNSKRHCQKSSLYIKTINSTANTQNKRFGTTYSATPKKTLNHGYGNKSKSPQKKLSFDSFESVLYTGNYVELDCQESMKVQRIFKDLFNSSEVIKPDDFGSNEIKEMSKYYIEFMEENLHGKMLQQKQLAAENRFVSQLQSSNQELWCTMENSHTIQLLNDCICNSHSSNTLACSNEEIISKCETLLRRIHSFLLHCSTFEYCNKNFNEELALCSKCQRKQQSDMLGNGWDTVGVWYPTVMDSLKGFQEALCIYYKSLNDWKDFYIALQELQILQFEIDVMELISLDIIPLLSNVETDSTFCELYECVSSLTSFTSSCIPLLVKYT